MKTNKFIATCLGIYDGTSKCIDDICDNFGIDIEDSDVYVILDNMESNYRSFGNALISLCYNMVIDKAVGNLGAEQDLFEVDVNDCASHLYYKNVSVTTWEELENQINEQSLC